MKVRAPSGVLWVAAAALLWSSGGLFIKLVPLPGLAVACGRALVTSLFYLVVLRPNLRHARWSTGLVYAAMTLTFVTATKLTTAANAIFLQYTGPAYVLLLAPWILKERLRAVDVGCVVASLAGMSLFFVGKLEAGHALGNALGAVSGVFFALTIVLMRRDVLGGRGDAMPSALLGNLLAFALALPFSFSSLHAAASPMALGGLLYLGAVQIGLAYLLFARGLATVPAGEASLISMLEPALNPVWVFLGTGERPGRLALLGGALVLGAVAARTLWGMRRETGVEST